MSMPPNYLGAITGNTNMTESFDPMTLAQNDSERAYVAMLVQVPLDQRADVIAAAVGVSLAALSDKPDA